MIALVVPVFDDLTSIALTVKQEAEGEPWEGKLAVAYVICNRAEQWQKSILDVVFQPWQFSAWNTESGTKMRLDGIPPDLWRECFKAACAAAFRLVPDPVAGAVMYLNVEATKKGRKDGRLPKWAADPTDPTKVDASKVVAVIGHHTFLR